MAASGGIWVKLGASGAGQALGPHNAKPANVFVPQQGLVSIGGAAKAKELLSQANDFVKGMAVQGALINASYAGWVSHAKPKATEPPPPPPPHYVVTKSASGSGYDVVDETTGQVAKTLQSQTYAKQTATKLNGGEVKQYFKAKKGEVVAGGEEGGEWAVHAIGGGKYEAITAGGESGTPFTKKSLAIAQAQAMAAGETYFVAKGPKGMTVYNTASGEVYEQGFKTKAQADAWGQAHMGGPSKAEAQAQTTGQAHVVKGQHGYSVYGPDGKLVSTHKYEAKAALKAANLNQQAELQAAVQGAQAQLAATMAPQTPAQSAAQAQGKPTIQKVPGGYAVVDSVTGQPYTSSPLKSKAAAQMYAANVSDKQAMESLVDAAQQGQAGPAVGGKLTGTQLSAMFTGPKATTPEAEAAATAEFKAVLAKDTAVPPATSGQAKLVTQGGQAVNVKGTAYGELLVHPAINQPGKWEITHLGSKLHIAHAVDEATAKKVAQKLQADPDVGVVVKQGTITTSDAQTLNSLAHDIKHNQYKPGQVGSTAAAQSIKPENNPATPWSAPHQAFDDIAAGDKFLKGSWKQAKPTTAQVQAVGAWQGSGYSTINEPLWHGQAPTGQAATWINQIDTFMATNSLPTNMVVTRGKGKHDPLYTQAAKLKVGDPYVSLGYDATMTGTKSTWNEGVQVQFRAPKGTPAIHMNSLPGYSSSHPSEHEVLLGRNLVWTVKGKTVTASGGIKLVVELVTQTTAQRAKEIYDLYS